MPESPAEFLARMLDRDEAVARAASPDGARDWDVMEVPYEGISIWPASAEVKPMGEHSSTTDHIAAWDPERVLAECAAKREVAGAVHLALKFHRAATPDCPTNPRCACRECVTIRALLRPYAGEPGFNPTWLED